MNVGNAMALAPIVRRNRRRFGLGVTFFMEPDCEICPANARPRLPIEDLPPQENFILPSGASVPLGWQPMSDPTAPNDRHRVYWRKNLTCLGILLAIWFLVSYGCGILFVDQLDKIRLPGTGFKLGFWFAQQGSIYVFVVLIWVYVRYMNKLDAAYRNDS